MPLLLAVPFGPFLAWKRGDILGAGQRLLFALACSLLVTVAILALQTRGPWLAPFGIGLGIWLIAGTVSEIAFRVKAFRASWPEVLRRLWNMPRAAYGSALAHIGVGVMVLGIVATSAWRSEKILAMKPGETVTIAGYELVFLGISSAPGPNYQETIGTFSVRSGGVAFTELRPSKRRFPVEKQGTTEAGIYPSWLGDLYVVLGDPLDNGAMSVRLYFNPLVRFIWIGAVLMFIAGFVSLSDRRLRIGAPRKTKLAPMPAAAE